MLPKHELEIKEFEQVFAAYKNKKIVIYGTGRYTSTLVNGLKGFNIIGLCDRDESLIGTQLCGKRVLSQQEVEEQADIVVINTMEQYWMTIYRRISHWKVPIYYRNGKKAYLPEFNNADNPYWNTSMEDLKQALVSHEVVSFDIFDTLVMRKVLLPFDVFRMVEKRLKENGIDISFCDIRKRAESLLENPTYDEIYEKIKVISTWSNDIVEYAKKCELEVETALLTGRKDMVDLCNQLICEREVYFVSDMYFSSDVLQDFLILAGVHAAKEQIIVSCEKKKTKQNGELWEWYQENIGKGRSTIHVGDNKIADIEQPKKYGVDTFYVMGKTEQLENSSLCNIVSKIVSLQSSIAIGLIAAKILNSPFALNAMKGMLTLENEPDAGYVIFGNIIYNFQLWLLKQAEEDAIDQLLFFARDGYLLVPQYRYMCEMLQKESVPESIYLDISRRAMTVTNIYSKEDILAIAKKPFQGSLKNFLWERFGVTLRCEENADIRMDDIQGDEEKLLNLIDCYQDEILLTAKCERENYLTYLKTLDIKEKTVAIVDTNYAGSTQWYLQKLLQEQVKGYYFVACLDKTNPYLKENEMKGCFQKLDDTMGSKCAVFSNIACVESFLTAPNGMFRYFTNDLKPCYAEKLNNQKYFAVREEMQKGVFSYLNDIIDLQETLDFKNMLLDEIFADDYFGLCMKGGVVLTKNMKETFYFDKKLETEREVRIWSE